MALEAEYQRYQELFDSTGWLLIDAAGRNQNMSCQSCSSLAAFSWWETAVYFLSENERQTFHFRAGCNKRNKWEWVVNPKAA